MDFFYFACHCVCLYVNCIGLLYTLIYVHIFSYLVSKLEIRWVYLSPIEKKLCCIYVIHISYKAIIYIYIIESYKHFSNS